MKQNLLRIGCAAAGLALAAGVLWRKKRYVA